MSNPVIDEHGNKRWYHKGELHRTDGPAVEYADGNKHWYLNGERHRTDGPAVEYDDGTKAWYLNGKQHRTDGPAVEYADGDKYWYLNNIRYTEIAFYQELIRTTDDESKVETYKRKLVKMSLK
jgi:hypothetical protein